jgi:DNA segregation ATPase FtsK/SpoIIIE, S-DNA-T family
MDHDSTIKLLLSVRRTASDVSDTDIAVELARDTRVQELSQALARYLGSLDGYSTVPHPASGLALHCTRLGRLAPGDCVNDTGLRSGDTVALKAGMRLTAKRPEHSGTSPPSMRGGIVDLVVNAGPQAGRRVSLLPGRYVLGRDPACEVVLDDPSLSRRHLQIEVGSDTVEIRDLGSRNGSAVEGRAVADVVQLTPDEDSQIEIGRSVITFSRAAPPVLGAGVVSDGSTPFNRPPRIVEPYRAPRFELEAAPPEAARVRLQVGAAVLPIVLGGAAAAILEQPALLLSMLLSPATLLWSYVSERRSGRLLFQQSAARYSKQLEALAGELELASARESAARRVAAPDAAELTARALEMRPELWERRPTDTDFLKLRIGVADLPAEFTVETPTADDRPLPAEARELLDAHRTVPMLPVVVDLPRVGSLGLAGPESRVNGLGLWLVLQTAVLHSPRELSIAAAVDPDQRAQWEWLKWIPHTRTDPSPIGGPHLVDDMPATQNLLQRVAELVSARRRELRRDSTVGFAPALVLFLDEDLVGERATVGEILERGPAVGVYMIWLGHIQRGLPGECRSIALLDQTVARLTFIQVGEAEQIADVAADAVEPGLALKAARLLVSIRDIGAPGARGRSGARTGPRRPVSGRVAHDSAPNAAATGGGVTIAPFAWSHASTDPSGSFMPDRSASRDTRL